MSRKIDSLSRYEKILKIYSLSGSSVGEGDGENVEGRAVVVGGGGGGGSIIRISIASSRFRKKNKQSF